MRSVQRVESILGRGARVRNVCLEENIVCIAQRGGLFLVASHCPCKQRHSKEPAEQPGHNRGELLPVVRNELRAAEPVHSVMRQDDLLPASHVIGVERAGNLSATEEWMVPAKPV